MSEFNNKNAGTIISGSSYADSIYNSGNNVTIKAFITAETTLRLMRRAATIPSPITARTSQSAAETATITLPTTVRGKHLQ